ncbi:MAG: carbohydrate kinase [Myxococcales bacterium]|nr:carbohydrate kinase [Myxococcales bacterium]
MIVCFGECLLDCFATPPGSSLETAASFRPCPGGAPANVAMVLGASGRAARFVGALGADAHGRRLMASLAAFGVDLSGVITVPERTGVTFVELGPDGQRSFLFYRRGAADDVLTRAMLAGLAAPPLRGAEWLVLGSSSLLNPSLAEATWALVDEAAARGVKLAVDLNVRAHLWPDRGAMRAAIAALVPKAALVKASDDDLAALGVSPSPEGLATLSEADLALTLGARGAHLRRAGRWYEAPAEAVTVVDATGAGDAFLAGLVAALSDGLDDGAAALRQATAWGARACTAVGAVTAFSKSEPEEYRCAT